MPFLGTTRPPAEVDHGLVKSCRDELMAVNRCIDLSGLTDEVLCERLGIDPGHFSRIRKGRAHFPTRKRLYLMDLCGNLLPLQYEAMRKGFRLAPIASGERERDLEERIRILERQAAA